MNLDVVLVLMTMVKTTDDSQSVGSGLRTFPAFLSKPTEPAALGFPLEEAMSGNEVFSQRS